MDPTSFLQGRSRETAIRRDAEGRWFYDREPLSHPNLVRAFDRWVERAEDGRYCLKNDVNWAYITLEGAPYFVRALHIEAGGHVMLELSDGSSEELDPSSLRQDRAGVLHCDVHDGTMAARFDRHVAGGLLELLGEDDRGVYLTIAGTVVRPPVVDDPLRPTGKLSQS
jgi:hypothetical protein